MITNTLANLVIASTLMGIPEMPREDLNEVLCMTEAIYYEARGEPNRGMAAVGLVIQNRVESTRYPDTVCEVVQQPLQFSYRNSGAPIISIVDLTTPNADALRRSLEISVDILNGHIVDFTNNSKHYYAQDLVNPSWGSYGEVVAVIEGHTFINNLRNR